MKTIYEKYSKLLLGIGAFLFMFNVNVCGQGRADFFGIVHKSIAYADSSSLQIAVAEILGEYHQKGYINAALDSIKTKKNRSFVYIYKGESYTIGKFEIQTPNETYAEIPIRVKPGRTADLIRLSAIKKELISHYENSGYPFAKVYSTFKEDSNKLYIRYTVDQGKFFVFDTILTNEVKISSTFLTRYLDIIPGNTYNEHQISKIDSRIKQLGFLQLQQAPVVNFGKGIARPELLLKTKQANRFNGLVGIVPSTEEDKKYIVTGDIELNLKNTLGKGESIDLQWKKTEKHSQQLQSGINWPYVFRTAFGADLGLKMLKQDTSFVHLDLKTGIFLLFRGNNSATGYYTDKRTIILSPKDTASIAETQSYGTGITLKSSLLDNRINPLKGYSTALDISAGQRKTQQSTSEKSFYWQTDISVAGFIPLYKNWVLMGQNHYLLLKSKKTLYKNELFRVGGLNTLRGFDENQFYINQGNISTIEFRWLFEENSHFKVFTDAAWLQTKHTGTTTENTVLGFGAGINLHTNAGIFTISYALNYEKTNKTQLNNAKIHFGYINSF
ncbi:MAG: ShlB/FhaC/HecB family hemolysin secretion/activation protein [Salinivirgaceae bacterium]